MIKVFDPIEFKKLSCYIEGDHDEYEELIGFFSKHKTYQAASIDVPRYWAGLLLGYLESMVRLDDALKFSKITSDNYKLEITHSYQARYKDETEAIKRSAAIAIDSLILEKTVEIAKTKGHLLS